MEKSEVTGLVFQMRDLVKCLITHEDPHSPEYAQMNQKLIKTSWQFGQAYLREVVKEGEALASELAHSRPASQELDLDDIQTASFNYSGACVIFKETLKLLLANACQLTKWRESL